MTSPRFRPERAWQRRDRVTGARRGSGRDGGAGRGWASPAVGVAAGAAARVGGSGRSRPQFVLLGVRVLLSQPRLLLCGQPLRLEERAAQVRGLRARAPARPEPAPPRGGAVGGAWANRGWGRAVRRWLWAPGTYCLLHRDHPAVIKRRFTSVLVVSSLSPLCVLLWRELTGIQPGTSLLTLMGFRLEGIFPAALLPLLLTMILFLGPLMQLSMDCPCDLADGLKVVLAPRSWARCLTDMRWLRNQVIAPLTEELVFRACMLPMLAPCTGLGPAVFTCPLFFGVASFPPEQCGEHLLVCSVPVLLHSCLRCLHCFPLHSHRTPDWAGSLPLLLQLHGLSCRMCGPGASAEVAPAGRLCPGCGTLPASAPAPHGP
ncbi:CAAX prenyl protease 2 isoform X9 [Physeter macrocephalus]|uniref:CAAX prenyl protease 2 n=1 Tax=Physeter macrocephalus TaxID=9755 RepID=A0A455CBR4_PHYMC|nr:CAAX prenyl protease 2 isoform X9 [Physeter catodon]|eukprot:XP_028356886.1 CAAX prenyl protease 2 isoform X6 [Physeter catodon]